MLVWIANSASFACCVSYCMVSMAFVRLRKKYPAMKRPFRVKKYKSVGFAAVVLSGVMSCMYLIPRTGCTLTIQEAVIVGCWILLGIIFSIVCKKIR